MTNKHIKRCLASLDIREMYVKTTMKYCHAFIRMTKIKRTIPDVTEVVKFFCGNINWYNNLGKLAVSSKPKIYIAYDPTVQMLLDLWWVMSQ